MNCTATYKGKNEKLGVRPGDVCLVELNTYRTKHGAPYLWLKVVGGTYLMPFASIPDLVNEWCFTASEDQPGLEREWMDVYLIDAED